MTLRQSNIIMSRCDRTLISPILSIGLLTVGFFAPAVTGLVYAADQPDTGTASSTTVQLKTDDPVATQIKNEIEKTLSNDKVTVTIKPLTGNRYVVFLSGTLDTDEDVKATVAKVTAQMKTMTGITFAANSPLDSSGLKSTPPPKDPRADKAKAIATSAQRYFNPDEVKTSVLNLATNNNNKYQIKLSGKLASAAQLKKIHASANVMLKEINDELESAKPANPLRVSGIDYSSLVVTPESVIQGAFKPLCDATGLTATIVKRKQQPDKVTYAVAISGALVTLEDIHTAERQAVLALKSANLRLSDVNKTLKSLNTDEWKALKGSFGLPDTQNQLDPLPELYVTGLLTGAVALKDHPATARWPISRLGSSGFTDLTTSSSPVDATVSALNGVFGTPSKPAAFRDGESIHMTGTLRDIRRMKSLVALADSAHPQVRLQFWPVQASGDRKIVARDLALIKEDIASTEQRIEGIHLVLQNALLISMIGNSAELDPFFCRFYAQMFGLQPWEAQIELSGMVKSLLGADGTTIRNYSNDEILILLGLLKKRDIVQGSLRFAGQAYRLECSRQLVARLDKTKYKPLPALYYLHTANTADVPSPANPANTVTAISDREWTTQKRPSLSDINEDYLTKAIGNIVTGKAEESIRLGNKTLMFGKLSLAEIPDHKDTASLDYRINRAPRTTVLVTEGEAITFAALSQEAEKPVFAHLTGTYTPSFTQQTRQTIGMFFRSLHNFYDYVRALGIYTFPQGRYIRKENDSVKDFDLKIESTREAYYSSHYYLDKDAVPISENPEDTAAALTDAPDSLTRDCDKTDALLAGVIEGLQADIDETYLKPLGNRIANNEGHSTNKDGITLGGRTEVTVSDHQMAVKSLQMYSYAQTSAPRPFSADTLLSSVAPASQSSTTVTKNTFANGSSLTTPTSGETETTQTTGSESGLAKLLGGLPLVQRVAISAAFQGEAPPNYSQIMPGISVSVTPSASLNGSTVELKLDARFGVPAVAPDDTSSPDLYQKARPSGVASDQVTTRVEVDGFRLFQISSDVFDTSVPQGNGGIPILARLPLIGTMFQWGRAPVETQHQSLLLVHAVIVPKALRLANFYGAIAARNHDQEPVPSEWSNNPLYGLDQP